MLPVGSSSHLRLHLEGAVIVHLYLDDIVHAEEFALHLKNIPFGFALLVSLLRDEDIKKTTELFTRALDRCTDCRVRRIARPEEPFESLFLEQDGVLSPFSYVCHLHSVDAPPPPAGRNWRQYLLAHLLGSERTVSAILEKLHDDPRLGLLLPAPHRGPAQALRWTHPATDRVNGEPALHTALPSAVLLSTAMFWGRLDALRSAIADSPRGTVDNTGSGGPPARLPREPPRGGTSPGPRRNDMAYLCLPVDPEFLHVYWKDRPFVDTLDPREHENRLLRYGSFSKRARVAVYTAIIDHYDTLMVPEAVEPEVDYVCFTNRPLDDRGVWKIKPCPWYELDPVRVARYVKTHPHVLLPEYDVAVWMDANVLLRGRCQRLVTRVQAEGRLVGVVEHPRRTDVREEAEMCREAGRDDREVIDKQIARYEREEVAADLLLAETNLLVLFHQDARVQKALTVWWAEISAHSRRDQLSCGYALKKTGLEATRLLPQGYSVRNHPDFALMLHGQKSGYTVPAFVRGYSNHVDPYDRGRFVEVREQLAKVLRRSVEIVVCVHNALDDVSACLESVLEHRSADQRLLIVDDASDGETAAFVRHLAASHDGVEVLRHDTQQFYCRAANSGLRRATAEFVILLNSDTVVSPQWVEKLLHCAEAAPHTGLVGPLSNAASWQSIPSVQGTATQTAVNDLLAGLAPSDLDRFCEEHSYADLFPSVSLLHGFCLGITRECLEHVGEFDEESFPQGFGEEDDYCLRAAAAGFGLSVATHTYVFHAKTKSYSGAEREEAVRRSSARLREKHGETVVARAVAQSQTHPLLERMRSAARALY